MLQIKKRQKKLKKEEYKNKCVKNVGKIRTKTDKEKPPKRTIKQGDKEKRQQKWQKKNEKIDKKIQKGHKMTII